MKHLLLLSLAAALTLSAEVKLGAPLTLKSPTPIADVNARAADLAGTTVQVKGKITEVCEKMGCWMKLVDPATHASIRIKVNDGEIVFPKDAAGKTAIAEGKLTRIEQTREQAIDAAKHEAEEQGRKFDPSSVTGPRTIFQIAGTGAVIIP